MNEALNFAMTYVMIGIFAPFVIIMIWAFTHPTQSHDLIRFMNKDKEGEQNPFRFILFTLLWPLMLIELLLIFDAYTKSDELRINTFDQYLKLKFPFWYRFRYAELIKLEKEKQKNEKV